MLLLAITASLAVTFKMSPGQAAPARKGSGSQGAVAQAGAFDSLKQTPMQQVLQDLISWKQSNSLHDISGPISHQDYNSLPASIKNARMEVIRACNLYHRAVLNSAQQQEFDRTILDPKGHPLPEKWEKMRLKGTLVSALLQSPADQQKKAQQVLKTFRERNHAIWGRGNDGGYEANLRLLEQEFRAILNNAQTKEFDSLWSSYLADIEAAKRIANK